MEKVVRVKEAEREKSSSRIYLHRGRIDNALGIHIAVVVLFLLRGRRKTLKKKVRQKPRRRRERKKGANKKVLYKKIPRIISG